MAVKVRRERPDQRRHHRVTAPLFVTLDGERVKAADWSIGGLRLDDFPGRMPVEASTIDLTLTLPFQGRPGRSSPCATVRVLKERRNVETKLG